MHTHASGRNAWGMTTPGSSVRPDEQLFATHTRQSGHMQRLELHSPWAFCVAESVRTALHVVLEGACRLVPTAGSPQLRVGRGDLILLTHGTGHVLADDSSPPPGRPDANSRRSIVLTGGYQVNCPLPLLASLPDVVYIQSDRCPSRVYARSSTSSEPSSRKTVPEPARSSRHWRTLSFPSSYALGSTTA